MSDARPAGTRAVLLDIEGTTTPLAFVTQVLFPYARTHLGAYLDSHAADLEPASILERLRHEHHAARQQGEALPAWTGDSPRADIASAISFVEWLMDRDRKSTPLKELQGLIWEDGYRRGALVGQVFPDVPAALQRWHEQQVPVCIYSSGSVLAQQLLFRHSSAGDLTRWLHAFFDTNIGAKLDPESYRRIAERLRLPAEAIVFLSDTPHELDAARQAGMSVRLMIRPGNAPLPDGDGYAALHNLDEL